MLNYLRILFLCFSFFNFNSNSPLNGSYHVSATYQLNTTSERKTEIRAHVSGSITFLIAEGDFVMSGDRIGTITNGKRSCDIITSHKGRVLKFHALDNQRVYINTLLLEMSTSSEYDLSDSNHNSQSHAFDTLSDEPMIALD